jgi:phosphate acetyltransferase
MKSKKDFLKTIKKKAAKSPQMIVFPESEIDNRIIEAAYKIALEKTAYPILLGDENKIIYKLKEYCRKIPDTIQIVDNHKNNEQREYYAHRLFELRKHKGLTFHKAQELLNNINYYGTMMVEADHAHGMISGTTFSTADTIRPALKIIKTKDKFKKVSSFFFMILNKQIYLFADCAINVNPSAEELADIGLDTALTAKRFGLDPKVAFLSFSTNGSAEDESLNKIKQAVQIAQKQAPDLTIEGEMQVDAAIVPKVAKRKWPQSQVAGQANVLIFPDLNSGNIAYKLVQRLAGAEAIGPILQGLKKPINDLSRGCDVDDIVNLAAITTIEAKDIPYSE